MTTTPSLAINTTIKVQNVISKPELNNEIGIIKSYNPDRDRYNIQLYNASPISPPVSLKVENLIEASMMEKVKGQLVLMKTMIGFMKNDPRVKEELWKLYHFVDGQLPEKVKPEYALGGIVVLFVGLVYVVGFSKMIVLLSIIGIIGTAAFPDIMNVLNRAATATSSAAVGMNDVKTIVKNFPSRWRSMIHDHTGYQLSPNVSTGILVGFLLLSTKILITPTTKRINARSNAQSQLTQTEHDYYLMKQQRQKQPIVDNGPATTVSFTMEDIYKMGYDDASNNHEYGTTLPENHDSFQFVTPTATSATTSATSTRSAYDDDEETFDYDDYKPTIPPLGKSSTATTSPPTSGGSKIGFGTLMSMFALFRSVKELGFVNGRFEYPFFMANVQNMPPLKMAFLGFMIYRVVTAFL